MGRIISTKYKNGGEIEKIAVHIKTHEEWDFVTKELKYNWMDASFDDYGVESCISLYKKGYCDVRSYKDWGYTIKSFESFKNSREQVFNINYPIY